MIEGQSAPRLVQDWLGSRYPKIADMCDRIQGLGDVLADIVVAIDAHATERNYDPATFRPRARIVGSTVRIELY